MREVTDGTRYSLGKAGRLPMQCLKDAASKAG
jgi:hypothetical protein